MARVREETSVLTESVHEVRFTDALAGADGTADAPPTSWRMEVFPDPLVMLPERPRAAMPAAAAHAPAEDRGAVRVAEQAAAPAAMAVAAPVAARASAPAAAARPAAWPAARPGRAPAPPPGQAPARLAAPNRGGMPPWYSAPNPAWAPPSQWVKPAGAPAAAPPRTRPAMGTTSYAPAEPIRRSPRPAQPPRPPAQQVLPRPAQTPSRRPTQATLPARPVPRPPAQSGGRRRSGGAWTFLALVVFFLVLSGAGRHILDALMELLNR